MNAPARWLRLWFTFESNVGRREYLLSGMALAALKYAGDVLLVRAATGDLWHPLDYLRPVSTLASRHLQDAPPSLLPLLALWALPFLWIGVSMSIRRALDAGLSAWLALLFFVPGLSWAFMAAMSVLPSRPAPARPAGEPVGPAERRLPRALLAIAAGGAIGVGMLALAIFGLQRYGLSLFLGTPFVIGAITAWLFNRHYPAGERETQQVTLMTLGCVGGVTLLAAAEGAICLLMAAPLAILIAAMGSALGRRIALHDRAPARHAAIGVLVLPLGLAMEGSDAPTALREVRSAVVIDAAPMEVWAHVVAFPPLPEPSEIVFRAGIAYPQRAEIVGEGVGAIRYCVFSTGPFVEPITVWEPGRRLAFDVTEHPAPMHEWSPYANVTPPHLDGWFRSRRGEFRFVPLADGRTRLEGSTWYELRLEPAAYWVLFADALVSRIHRRVLEHVKRETERAAPRSAAG